jgi:hypothetical protein
MRMESTGHDSLPHPHPRPSPLNRRERVAVPTFSSATQSTPDRGNVSPGSLLDAAGFVLRYSTTTFASLMIFDHLVSSVLM